MLEELSLRKWRPIPMDKMYVFTFLSKFPINSSRDVDKLTDFFKISLRTALKSQQHYVGALLSALTIFILYKWWCLTKTYVYTDGGGRL